nr:Yip1 family protein [Marininema halotolerans]
MQKLVLLILFGLTLNLESASIRGLGDRMELSMILIVSVLSSIVVGFIWWWVISFLLHWMSRLLGGTATFLETRQAILWATLAYTAKLVIWIPQLLIFGKEMFTDQTPVLDSSMVLQLLFILFVIISAVFSIWLFVILSKALAEVHDLTNFRGFGAIIIPISVLIVLKAIISI